MPADRKNQPKATRNTKSSNGTILKQINLLRKQLSELKQNKKIDDPKNQIPPQQKQTNSYNINQQSLLTISSQTKHENNERQQFFANYLNVEKQILKGVLLIPGYKEIENKINIWIIKLCRAIKKGEMEVCYKNLYRIVSAFRKVMNNQDNMYQKLKPMGYTENMDTLQYYQNCNRELEKQVIDLKQELVFQIDQVHLKQQELIEMDAGCKVLIDKYQQIYEQLQTSKQIYSSLRTQRQQLEQKCKIYQRTVAKKQEEIVLLQEDLRQNKKQSQKHRQEKIDFERMHEQLLAQYRELQNNYDEQIAKIDKQAKKWKAQYQQKRLQDKQIASLHEKISILKKENQAKRKSQITKNQEYSNLLQKLHEQQKINMNLSNQKHRLQIENEKLLKSVQYCKKQMDILNDEVSQLRNIAYERSKENNQWKQGIINHKSQQKIAALGEIQALIRQQKQLE